MRRILLSLSVITLALNIFAQSVTTDSSVVSGLSATVYGTYIPSGILAGGEFIYGTSPDNLNLSANATPTFSFSHKSANAILTPSTEVTYYYAFRAVTASEDTVYGDTLSFLIPTTPSVQAHSLNLNSNIEPASIYALWSKGSGARRICLVNTANSFPTSVDLNTNDYSATANANYLSAPSAAGSTGAKVVYASNGANVNVTGLSENTQYFFKVIEYNFTGASTDYSDAVGSNNPSSETTILSAPTMQAYNIAFSNVEDKTMNISWTNGNGANRVCIISDDNTFTSLTDKTTYPANTVYSGSGDQVIYNGTGTTVSVSGLSASTTYYFKIVEYNNVPGLEKYNNNTATDNPNNQTTTAAYQAEDVILANLTNNSVDVSWTNGQGANRVCLVNTSNSFPTSVDLDGQDYSGTASSDYSIAPDAAGATGAKVVYANSGSSVIITGLNGNTQYYIKVIEYNGTGAGTTYFDHVGANNPNNATTYKDAPDTQATAVSFANVDENSMDISWTNGNGDGRVCIINTVNSFSNIEDGSTPTANTVYGGGEQVLYNGVGTGVTVTGLNALTKYFVKVVEYSNGAGNEIYNNSTAVDNPDSTTTTAKPAPTVQALNLSFSSITNNSITVTWERGNGEGCLLLINEDNNFWSVPDGFNNCDYANTDYTDLFARANGEHFAYCGTGTSAIITNLNAATTYYFKVVEYNNSGSDIKYIHSASTNNPSSSSTLKNAPTIQASSIVADATYSSSIDLSWTAGNGDNKVCFINTSNSFPASLTDGTVYAVGQIVGGAEVIYVGSNNSTTATGLSAETTYWFRVYEYNNTGTATKYINATATNNPNSFATVGIITWNGGTSSNWDVGTNWSGGAEPNGSDVIISGLAANMPIISSTGNTVNDITIEAGASLTINNGCALSVSGNAIIKTPGDNGATGQLVIPGNGTFNVSGTTTVERSINNDGTFILAPITTANAYSSYYGYYVDVFDESALGNGYGGWVYKDSAYNQTGLEACFINKGGASPATISYTGTLKNGNQSISINDSGGDADNGWAIVGNPYPCAIDVENAGFNYGNIEPIIYIYNHGTSYAQYDISTHFGTNGGTQYVAAMQGFWMENTTGSAQSLQISNSCRVSDVATFYKKQTAEFPLIKLRASNDVSECEAAILFLEGFTSELDKSEAKFIDDPWGRVFGAYTKSTDGQKLAINKLSLSDFENINNEDSIFVDLGLLANNYDYITIEAIDIRNVPSYVDIRLYNKMTNKSVSLIGNSPIINVAFSETNSNDRGTNEDFQVLLTKKTAISSEDNIADANISYFVNENIATVSSNMFLNNSGTIFVYDITGRLVSSKNLDNNIEYNIHLPSKGTYLIKTELNNNIFTKKVVNI